MTGLAVGRTVHYVSYGTPNGEFPSVHRAATVTATRTEDPSLDETTVSLFVMNPNGTFHNLRVTHDPDGGPGTWHWPEYVA